MQVRSLAFKGGKWEKAYFDFVLVYFHAADKDLP